MNTRLLRKVAKHIAEEPRRLDMGVLTDLRPPGPLEEEAPPCGTVGCIAGWACVITGSRPKSSTEWNNFWHKGRRLLKLTRDESEKLFNPPDIFKGKEEFGWPLRFARRYEKAKTPRGRALATVARIEHFIKTKGKE